MIWCGLGRVSRQRPPLLYIGSPPAAAMRAWPGRRSRSRSHSVRAGKRKVGGRCPEGGRKAVTSARSSREPEMTSCPEVIG